MTIVEKIKEQIDTIDLIRADVGDLKRNGRGFECSSPFREDKNPSFYIWPDGGWSDWGTGEHGDCFDYIQKRDGVDFGEALHVLARMAGVDLSQAETKEARQQRKQQEAVEQLLTVAADFYHKNLWSDSDDARHALNKRARRGFDDEILCQVRWGYSRSDDGLLKFLTEQHPELVKLSREYGLIRADGNDFTANGDGDKLSPEGWIIYPHYKYGRLNSPVHYLSSRAVSDIEKGSKSRNLVNKIPLQPYCLFEPPTINGQTMQGFGDDPLIVEGPADAVSVWAMGSPAAALMTQKWNDKFHWLKSQLRRKQRNGATIFVAPSNDAAGQAGALGEWKNHERVPGVCEAISPLCRLIWWPNPDGQKADANDFLGNGGSVDGLRHLQLTAPHFLDILINDIAGQRAQTKRLKALAALLAELDEDNREDYLRSIHKNPLIKMEKAKFEKLVKDALLKRTGNQHEITIHDGQFWGNNGPLASLLIRIKSEQTLLTKQDDTPETQFLVEGILPDERRLRPLTVAANEFNNFNKWMSPWGVEAYLTCGQNGIHLLNSTIRKYSLQQGIDREELFAFCGWHEIGGRRGFLTNSGFLTATGLDESVKVRMQQEHQDLFKLPAPPDDIEAEESLCSSLKFLDVGPDEITVPIYLAQWCAPLRPLQSLNAIMVLYGPTQSRKSSTSHLALCHWGNFMKGASKRDFHTVIDAGSTATKLESYNAELSDMVLVIDDVPPGSSRFELEKQRKTVEKLARQIGNRAGRGRYGWKAMDPTVGVCMVTAEKIAMQIGSAVGRSIIVEFERGSIDTGELTEAQQHHASRYSTAMAAYIQWLAVHWESIEAKLAERLNAHQLTVERRYSEQRLVDYYSTLMAAGDLLLEFAMEKGAVDEIQAEEYADRFKQALLAILDTQEGRMAEMQISRRFFEGLRAILNQYPHSIIPITGRTYTDELGSTQTAFDPPPGSPLLGWQAEENNKPVIYLHDDVAIKLVVKHFVDMGGFLDVNPMDLRKEFYNLDLLAAVDQREVRGRPKLQLAVQRRLPNRGKTRILIVDPVKIRDMFDVELMDFPENED